ncbi:hypothetical protein NMB32_17880 [Stenotrophomonas sp. CD2]|nr:hypothetical protein NMB32_17880 [Stenotrophomonas sp. CD2]
MPPPQIAATPPSNTLTLPTGGSGAVNLQIANTGGSPLEWQIDNSGVGTRTLVAQAANNANGRRSTRFTDAVSVGARAQLAADDFTLGEATGITRIVADGFVNGGTLATSTNINWSIFRDVGGNPEGNPESSPQVALWTYTSTVSGPGVRTSATLATINLDMAAAGQNVNLPAGRYWLVVSVRAPLATSWFWFNATSGDSVYRSAIINPDGSGAGPPPPAPRGWPMGWAEATPAVPAGSAHRPAPWAASPQAAARARRCRSMPGASRRAAIRASSVSAATTRARRRRLSVSP